MNLAQIKKYLELAEKATPGPWFNGSWLGMCHEEHAHGRDFCNYKYTKSLEGESLKCVSVDGPDPIELIGWDDYGTILKKVETADFIATSRTIGPVLAKALIIAMTCLKECGERKDVGEFVKSGLYGNCAMALADIEVILGGGE